MIRKQYMHSVLVPIVHKPNTFSSASSTFNIFKTVFNCSQQINIFTVSTKNTGIKAVWEENKKCFKLLYAD